MSYTVEKREGVTLITGQVPVNELTGLITPSQRGAVMSDDLARLAGVNFAWGPPDAVDALSAKLRNEKLGEMDASPPEPGGLSKEARRWAAATWRALMAHRLPCSITTLRPTPMPASKTRAIYLDGISLDTAA